MKSIKVKDIIEICKGTLICGNENQVCENFSKDTRQINPGDVYVGLKGEKFDGSIFYEEALEKGAKVCLLEKIEISKEVLDKYKEVAIITVENTLEALQKLASYKRSLYDIPVVAVTGSVGKTSTKDMIASVLMQKYHVQKTMGNYNNHIGLPLTILGLKDHTALVVEMGMNNFGELSVLTNIAKPNICVITNVGTAHIGNLGSRENILRAKLEILEGLQKGGTVIINNDNDLLHKWNIENKEYKVVDFGIENQSKIMAKEIELQEYESNFMVEIDKTTMQVSVPVGGIHFVYNALCAICVGMSLDIPKENMLKGIKEFELSKSRMEILKNSQEITIINDCYNANFDSMKASISSLARMNAKRKIAVLGDMLELGEYSKQLHENVGIEVANNHIDILITVGEESKYIVESAMEQGMQKEQIYHMGSVEEAIKVLKEKTQKGDIILVKASNGMNFKKIVEEIKK